ncbi:hypothetical protein [Novosphingobium sp. MMS21-SN21R]|uniref:hypothetical protein n=1 Tax=Novosphingobium sp. MMS21-SN21R TaxID=2969298 RepID=UPI002884B245|nr:hypothetical protein [Novosphingobium sp. MMS21-SN21R]MDT0509379.1 hypothetical protein [Novosphingobium sp. MMS21-SN21R]
MKFTRVATALVATAMLTAPIAAQAGTRANSAAVYPSATYSANRASAKVDDENGLKPAIWVIVLLSGGAAAYGLSRAFDNKSNGAN